MKKTVGGFVLILAAAAALAFGGGCQSIKDYIHKKIADNPPASGGAAGGGAGGGAEAPAAEARDAVPFSSLRWEVGGQRPGDRPITIGWDGGARFDNNGCSFSLPKYNGASAYTGGSSDAPYIFCMFVPDGRGGKIDWVGGNRNARDFKHITSTGNYNNWHSLEGAVHAADKLHMVILGGNGRSPIIEAVRK